MINTATRPIREYFDKNGILIRPGDLLKFDEADKIERVYLLQGSQEDGLGINASNEVFLDNHPFYPREFYPLSEFDCKECEVIGHEN